jgi:transcriptional regulator GlxA family with amidase domain
MRRAALLGLDRCRYSSLAGLIDLCALGNGYTSRLYEPVDGAVRAIEVRVLSADGGPLTLADGRVLAVDGGIDSHDRHDIVQVGAFDPGDEAALEARLSELAPVYEWLRGQKAAGARLAAQGAAVFVLAEAGLLVEATVPWLLETAFRKRYPRVPVDPSRRIVERDGVFTANGLGAEPALALRLIETVLSPNLANVLAKHTGIDSHPDEPDPEGVFSGDVMRDDPLVGRAQLWLQQRFSQRSAIADLAQAMSVSQRTLTRRFQTRLGMTPQAYLQHLRIEAAKNMLSKSARRIERIAFMVGYGDVGFFKRLFRSRVGVTPAAFRKAAASHRTDDKPGDTPL